MHLEIVDIKQTVIHLELNEEKTVMKVELSIADDRELRNTIKDMIKGEVVSVARGEIRGIIAEVTREGYIPKDSQDVENIVRAIIKEEVKSKLKESGWGNSESMIGRIAREEIRAFVREQFKSGAIP
jgi:phosphoenolpyruvate-protein kinase (PTS system EI component)